MAPIPRVPFSHPELSAARRQESTFRTIRDSVKGHAIPLATCYASDVNAPSTGPRVNAVTSGMTSNCFFEIPLLSRICG